MRDESTEHVWRRGGLYRYGWAAVKRSRDTTRSVEYGTAMTRRGAVRAAGRVTAEREAVEGLLWEEPG